MARKIKTLSVKTRGYKDKDGNPKANYQNVGAIMENDNGGQFMLIDKYINFAGLPDFSGKENNGSILVNIFDVDIPIIICNTAKIYHHLIKAMII